MPFTNPPFCCRLVLVSDWMRASVIPIFMDVHTRAETFQIPKAATMAVNLCLTGLEWLSTVMALHQEPEQPRVNPVWFEDCSVSGPFEAASVHASHRLYNAPAWCQLYPCFPDGFGTTRQKSRNQSLSDNTSLKISFSATELESYTWRCDF